MNAPDFPNENASPSNEPSDFEKFCVQCGEKFKVKKVLNETYAGRAGHLCSKCASKVGEMIRHGMDCCENNNMVNRCIDKGGWALIVPYVVGVLLFLAGWFLSAEAVKTLWLVISGLVAVIGFVGLIMVNLIIRDRSSGGSGVDQR